MFLLVIVHKECNYTHFEFVVEYFDEENVKDKMEELIKEFPLGSVYSITHKK